MLDLRNDAATRGGRLARCAQSLLVVAGAAMLAWYALLVTDATLAQQVARLAIETAPRDATAPSPPPPTEIASVTLPEPAVVVRGSALADLSIPRVDFSAVVLQGSDARTLRRGPGHLENTALPGESGNVVIAGHRDSFFRPLRDVAVGDDIFVDTPRQHLHYRVTWLRVVNPYDLSVIAPTRDATLTLITCYPFWVLGPASDRFVVRATQVALPGVAGGS